MFRTCGEPSAYELRTSPEFADWHEDEPEQSEIEAAVELMVGMETER